MRGSCVTISPDPHYRHRLVVMVKEPRPGRVKTRLGHEIGMIDAATWFRHQSRDLLRRLRDPRWELLLAVTPDKDGLESRVWPVDLPRVAQGHGNLGSRMARQFRTLPRGPICIIGADIPGIRRHHITQAFNRLGKYDAVFGPATDGGYWLIGLKRTKPAPPSLFRNVRWSTQHALADTIATIPSHRIAMIATLADVDTAADLARHAPSFG